MKRLICCSLPRWSLTLAALAAVMIAVAAYPLGLDNNPVMGPRRILLLVTGLATILLLQYRRIAGLLQRREWPPDGPAEVPPPQQSLDVEPQRIFRWAWPTLATLAVVVAFLYSWLVTAGRWTNPPGTTLYYNMLAEAFGSGQTYLQQEPDPRLALSPDPYDPALRGRIPRCHPGGGSNCLLWDASYYGGRYYLYWGPAPAVVLQALKLGGVGPVGDNTLALAGAIGLFALSAYCLVDLWRRFFSDLPAWLLVPPLVLAGVAYPLPWALDAPRIYEAAILIGAAFLLAGLLAAMPALAASDFRPGRLTLAGMFWAMAFATRAVLAFPIAALCAAIAWRVFRNRNAGSRPRGLVRPLAMLGLPLVAALALIGFYNFVRFSDPLEFGWRYALGPPAGQSAGTRAVFDLGNMATNAYNYLLAPATLSAEAPYIQPQPPVSSISVGALRPIQIPHPDLFYGEYITGILFTTPFLGFAAYLLWWSVCASVCAQDGRARVDASTRAGPGPFANSLFLASAAAFLPTLTLYAVTARYLLDVAPMLTILAGVGSWSAYRAGAGASVTRWFVSAASVASVAASAAASILLGLNNPLR